MFNQNLSIESFNEIVSHIETPMKLSESIVGSPTANAGCHSQSCSTPSCSTPSCSSSDCGL